MWSRLDQAYASAKKVGADLFPHASGYLGYNRKQYAGNDSTKVSSNTYSFGLTINYELDIWKRIRSQKDASLLDIKASVYDLQAAAITLTSNIARYWYQLIERYKQLDILETQIEINTKNLKIITLKFEQGRSAVTDVLQQKQTLESNKSDKILIEKDIEIIKNQLAILCGVSPGGIIIPKVIVFPSLPQFPQIGPVSEWLKRRPDLRKLYTDIQASDKRVATGIAELYPKIGLSVDLGTTTSELRDWFSNWLATFAANLVAPLFEAGKRLAEVERLKAIASEKFYTYGDKVLIAIKEVEDAIISEIQQKNYIKALNKRLTISENTLGLTQNRYIYGQKEFLQYLTSLINHQLLQRTSVSAKYQLILYRIQLYKAIAGSLDIKRHDKTEKREKMGEK